MGKTERYIVFGVLALIAGTFFFAHIPGMSTLFNDNDVLQGAARLIAFREGFRSAAYWDVSRYSWGYGTPAPGPGDTITQADAMNELIDHMQGDYSQLKPLITRALSLNQWIAYLDFSYNEGVGAAMKLLDDINAGQDGTLEQHWKLYVYAGGVVNSDLVDRRNVEWDLFTS